MPGSEGCSEPTLPTIPVSPITSIWCSYSRKLDRKWIHMKFTWIVFYLFSQFHEQTPKALTPVRSVLLTGLAPQVIPS